MKYRVYLEEQFGNDEVKAVNKCYNDFRARDKRSAFVKAFGDYILDMADAWDGKIDTIDELNFDNDLEIASITFKLVDEDGSRTAIISLGATEEN